MHLGVISQAIIQKGGLEIPKECSSRTAGDFGPFLRVTGAYALNCKHVLHVVTPKSINEYADRILLALNAANTLRLQSVAIPTIGTGKMKMTLTTQSGGVVRSILWNVTRLKKSSFLLQFFP